MTEAERATYRGHDGAQDWFEAVFDIFPDWRPVLQESRALGDWVVSTFDVTATAATSGARVEQSYWYAAHLREGRIAWFGFFRTKADALEVARKPSLS